MEREAGNALPRKRACTSKGTCSTSKDMPDEGVVVIDAWVNITDVDNVVDNPLAVDLETASNIQPGPSNAAPGIIYSVLQLDDAATQLFEAERRVEYEKIPKAERKRGVQKVEKIEPALDDMINVKDNWFSAPAGRQWCTSEQERFVVGICLFTHAYLTVNRL